MKYEHLYTLEIQDGLDLTREAENFRDVFNTLGPHEALSWNRPIDIQAGRADPRTPNFPEPENLPKG